MALDFPNSPVVGATYTSGPGGPAWQWDGVKWESIGVPGATGAAGPVSRNLLHNPYFNIQQRGAGSWSATGASPYTADRWQATATNDTYTLSVVSLADSDRAAIGDESAIYSLQSVFAGSATAGSYSFLIHKIENLRRLSGKQVTVSFWARATSGTPRVGIGWSQIFGSGGSPSAQVTGNLGVTPALSTTWQRYNVTGTLPSASGKTFGTTLGTDMTSIEWWFSDQGNFASRSGGIGVQSATVQLWGTQCEIGPIATPLEKIDPRFDLSNCQRFYTVLQPNYTYWQGDGNAYQIPMALPVTMRATPSGVVSNFSGTGQSSGYPHASASSPSTCELIPAATTYPATVGAYCTLSFSADL